MLSLLYVISPGSILKISAKISQNSGIIFIDRSFFVMESIRIEQKAF